MEYKLVFISIDPKVEFFKKKSLHLGEFHFQHDCVRSSEELLLNETDENY